MSADRDANDASPSVAGLLPRIADQLQLRVIAPLAGGEFGATLVSDRDGRELVLKAMPGVEWAPRFARGAALVALLRARGYPAPEYFGAGHALGASWSLQERLRGAVPDHMNEAHARRLLELADMHSGAAGDRKTSKDQWLALLQAWRPQLAARNDMAYLVREVEAVMDRASSIDFLTDGVVHMDFHHRNFLAVGDQVTGVFDWELASVGDWRYDLVTLAYWSSILPEQIAPEVAQIVVDRMRERCPPDVVAFFAALRTLIQLDFDTRVHPDRLGLIIPRIEQSIAPWWRET